MFARAKKGGSSLRRPFSIYTKRRSRIIDKECQANFINYRKGGQAFINLVTIIPIAGGVHNTPEEADEVVYHVGFQVDLMEQPNAILSRLWDGSYIVNYGAGAPAVPSLPAPPPRERKVIISKDLQALLLDPAFVNSLPISTGTIASTSKKHTREKPIAKPHITGIFPRFHTRLIPQRVLPIRRPFRPERTRVRGRRAGREIDSGVSPSGGSRTPYARAKRIVGP